MQNTVRSFFRSIVGSFAADRLPACSALSCVCSVIACSFISSSCIWAQEDRYNEKLLSLSLSLSLCLCLCLSVCLSVSPHAYGPRRIDTMKNFSLSLPVSLSLSLSVCLSVCLSVSPHAYGPRRTDGMKNCSLCLCLSVCLSVCLSACLSVCLSVFHVPLLHVLPVLLLRLGSPLNCIPVE